MGRLTPGLLIYQKLPELSYAALHTPWQSSTPAHPLCVVLLLLPGLGPHHTANRYPARPCGIRYPKAYAVPPGWIKHLCKVLTKSFKQALHTNHPAIWVSMEPLNWLQDQRKWVVFSEESDYRQTMPPGVPWSVKYSVPWHSSSREVGSQEWGECTGQRMNGSKHKASPLCSSWW